MKTTLLEEYVQKLPSGEEFDAVNEWNRRRVTKNEGRMKEWSDGKLDGYITMLRANEAMINEKECVKLQQNMMETRGVRRKSNEKMIEMMEKLEADTEELKIDINEESDRYKATLDDSDKIEKNHLRVMAEVKSTRKIKGELNRALREKKDQERRERQMLKEQLKNEKIDERKEKETMRMEDNIGKRVRKDELKKQKDLKALLRKNGSVRQNLRGERSKIPENLNEEQKQIDIESTLEAYDKLVHLCYTDPETGEFMEVINVYVDNGSFMSTSRIIHKDGKEEEEEVTRTRKINGENGTMELVSLEMTGKTTKVEIQWPKCEEEWIKVQEEDAFCKKLLDEITDKDMKKYVTTNQVDPEKANFYFRSYFNNNLGVLK